MAVRYPQYIHTTIVPLGTSLSLLIERIVCFCTMICINKKNLILEVLYTFVNYLYLELDFGPFSRPTQHSAQDGNRCCVGWRHGLTHTMPHYPLAYSLPPTVPWNLFLRTSVVPWGNSKVSPSRIRHSVVDDGRLVSLVGWWVPLAVGKNVSMLSERVRGETKTKSKKFSNDQKEDKSKWGGERKKRRKPIRLLLAGIEFPSLKYSWWLLERVGFM